MIDDPARNPGLLKLDLYCKGMQIDDPADGEKEWIDKATGAVWPQFYDSIGGKDKLDKVLETLTFREREIIKLRYGIGDGYTYTLEEVGRIFKVTRERVRQIEAKAVRKLQQPSQTKALVGFLDGAEVPIPEKNGAAKETA